MTGIYKITNIITGHFYIGVSNNIERRFSEHKTPKNRTKNTKLAKAFLEFGVENFRLDILEECSVVNLLSKEVVYIALFKPEYNMNEGGKGNPRPMPDMLKAHLSVKNKEHWNKKSEAEKQKIIKNLTGPKKGFILSDKTREKIRNKLLGLKQSSETKAKRSRALKIAALGNKNGNKPVIQLLNGIELKRFLSVKDAALSINIHPSGITSVLKKKQKTAGGYAWKFVN